MYEGREGGREREREREREQPLSRERDIIGGREGERERDQPLSGERYHWREGRRERE